MLKKILYIAVGLIIVFAIVKVNDIYHSFTARKTAEESVVLLESIRKVTKLVTVEGYFTEVYDYKDYYGFDISPLRKKALIRLKAKVSVGYDFDKLKITADDSRKIIHISSIGKPQILSVDHKLDYYDISQGTFNSFTSEDYNRMNQNAKDFIISKVKESDSMNQAGEQMDGIIETIKTLTESRGWQIVVEKEPTIQ